MPKRDFLAITDLSRDEILRLFELAHRMKTGTYRETPLAGKTLAMIFAKSSTRTSAPISWAARRCSCLPGTSSSVGGSPLPTRPECCRVT